MLFATVWHDWLAMYRQHSAIVSKATQNAQRGMICAMIGPVVPQYLDRRIERNCDTEKAIAARPGSARRGILTACHRVTARFSRNSCQISAHGQYSTITALMTLLCKLREFLP